MCIICKNNGVIPVGTKELRISECQISVIPELPSSLEEFSCSGCTGLTNIPELPSSLKRFFCSGYTNVIFCQDKVAKQIGVDIVEVNYQRYRKEQCFKYFSDREGLLFEELIIKTCHPDRIMWYMDLEELKFMGLVQ